MPWTSKYSALFTKPLVRQLLAIIQRDQRAALDDVGGANVLPSIVEYNLALAPIHQFPAVLVAPQTDEFDRAAVGSLYQTIRVYCGVVVTHQQRDVLAEQIQDYVRALDEVFNSVALSDFYLALPLTAPPSLNGTTTAGMQAGSLLRLFVEGHAYDEIRQGPQRGFAMAATLSLLFEQEEK